MTLSCTALFTSLSEYKHSNRFCFKRRWDFIIGRTALFSAENFSLPYIIGPSASSFINLRVLPSSLYCASLPAFGLLSIVYRLRLKSSPMSLGHLASKKIHMHWTGTAIIIIWSGVSNCITRFWKPGPDQTESAFEKVCANSASSTIMVNLYVRMTSGRVWWASGRIPTFLNMPK